MGIKERIEGLSPEKRARLIRAMDIFGSGLKYIITFLLGAYIGWGFGFTAGIDYFISNWFGLAP